MTEQQVDRTEIVCPECGTAAGVALNRRDAQDFCAQCDFPLFWTPAEVIRDGEAGGGESLRRLPGTAGRVTVAAVPCPTCAEANPVGAQTCLRCGGPMVLPVPEPTVVVELPAPVEPEPEPRKRGIDWYWWVVGAATLVALVALVVVVLVR